MKSFFRLFFRVSTRNKTFSLLNILGLAVGLAGFIMIMLWVVNELSYDNYNKAASRIYRIKALYHFNGIDKSMVGNPAPMAASLKNEFPEVENAVRFRDYGSSIIRYGENSFKEERIIFADSTVFDIFTIPVVRGNPKTALCAPNSITLSEKMAIKYFGKEDPVGKLLKLDNEKDYQVTGVFSNIPQASHFHFDFIASANSNPESREDTWLSNNFVTYVLLKEKADAEAFEKKLSLLVDKYLAVQVSQYMGIPWSKIQQTGATFIFSAQKLRDIHMHSHEIGELGTNGDMQYVYIFTIVAFFILLLACINFTNLSTAKATVRAKEVGMKRMFGEGRVKLAGQFVFESFVIVAIAFIVAILLVELSIPYFNELSGKKLALNLFDPKFGLGMLVLVILTSLLAGSYPSFYLSSYRPISAIRREMFTGKKKTIFRSILVTGQFVISLILLMSTLLLMKQMHFIQQKKLGYDKENICILNNTYLLGNSIGSFKTEIMKHPDIIAATISGYLPVPSNRSSTALFKDAIKTEDFKTYQLWRADCDYVKTMGMKVIKGRDFSKSFSTDSSAVILNEAAAKAFGWDDPIGKKIGIPSDGTDLDIFHVVGVVKDFNFESVHNPVEPLVLIMANSPGSIAIRIKSNTDIPSVVNMLGTTWKRFAPHQPFEYEFLEESLNKQYKTEVRLGKILGIFTGLAFFVSCLGLFGLALFTTEQRRKEIGIRKVNGSGIGKIIGILSFDFTRLVLVAFIISCPAAYFIMQKWLENFAFRTGISWWIFVATGLICYVVTLLTIGFQSYRAAAVNPVETLRSE